MHIGRKKTPLKLYIMRWGISILHVWSVMDFTVAWKYLAIT